MEISDIKLGTRVTYATGEAEYDAVALGSVTTGFNNAIRKSGFFLTLRYLDENAQPVTISGAALLGVDEGRVIGWHARRANDDLRPEPQTAQPAPDHEIAQPARLAPLATMGIGPVIEPPPAAEEPGSGSKRVSGGDYSQADDPYGIAAEYTSQSAAVDVRGNSPIVPRGLPTQEEADAIVATAAAERFETKTYANRSTTTGPNISPAEQELAEAQAKAAAELAAADAGAPSAEDLDAVAAEQSAAEATSEPAPSPADDTAGPTEAAE